ncbi:LacI family DNA-binding transcriptional regulator [Pelagibacterium sp. 26DY04]|uniref:LacI family DNA-binding transcriptional regulator n=1 Tax=Pelagibacterium sp. 26DY04 TaxID=2967130 RepID=UPI002815D1A2|nr:LacI family DNA-binding transcriptional regulator [Pelagibacterium sp. 26DY04]WMT85910.1 LacI family DNA-binding transcriptional regulator [Pelagibacterium sp. 26DY04]
MRATLVDIAREAGVSSATVDRVLNDRPGVKERTRLAVRDAAIRLGYIDSAPHPSLASEQALTLDIVLPGGSNSFMRELHQHIEALAPLPGNATIHVHIIDGFEPSALAAKLTQFEGPRRGVALVGIDHPLVREAIRALVERGVPVVTLVSDIHHVPRAGYIGIDNRSAGRLAGYLMGRMLGPGDRRVAMFTGSFAYRGHEEREMGFRHVMAEMFPQIAILDSAEVRDEEDRAYAVARAVLAEKDIDAIYNIGAGNRGIARALKEAERAQDVLFVGHDLTPHTKSFLLDGTMDVVIDQNPRVQAREVLAQLTRTVRGQDWTAISPRVQAIFRENIPEA